MEKYHYLNRITKKDLYRVLRYKYPLSFHRIAQRGQQHDVVIFQETIDLLEKYDQLLLMLKNDVEPTHLDWPNFTDTKRIEFYNWILSLKYPRNILPELDEIKFSVFRKISQYLGQSRESDLSAQDVIRNVNVYTNLKHLVKPVQQYLSYADLTYSEYSYLSTNEEEYLFLGNVLGKIEVFCETLKAVKSELFIIPQSIFGVFSPEEYLKISTRLGQMWLSLFTSLLEKEGLIKLLREAKFRSQNILSFMIFLKGNWQELQQLHNQQLNQFKIVRLNQIFSLLKNELTNHTLLESTRDLDNRLKKLTKYSRYLLARDVYILRFQIEFTTQSRYLNKTEQSSLLTEFLRVGQSAQPLCWLRGYLLRWDQHYCTQRQSRQTYADLTLCFEYQSKLQDVNLIEILKEYLTEFIARYNKKKKLSNAANEIDCSMLSCNIFSPKTELRQKVLKIETIDKELRKSFMKSYVPYFCFLDLFIVWVEMDNGKKIKRFTTGQKPKSKKIST